MSLLCKRYYYSLTVRRREGREEAKIQYCISAMKGLFYLNSSVLRLFVVHSVNVLTKFLAMRCMMQNLDLADITEAI